MGKARFTPDGYEIGDEGLVYLDAPDDGDGRVTVHSALLPGVRTWQLDCEHGGLPDKKEAFEAYRELLETGTTNLLQPFAETAGVRGAAPSAAAHARSRPSRTRVVGPPPDNARELLMLDSRQPAGPAARGAALQVTVVNGDLTFVRQPLLLGHYQSLRLTGTERVMNKIIGDAMDESLKVGLYPSTPGTHQVFVNTRANTENPWQLPRPEAVIVVGLGEEGKLRPSDLVHSVRQAVFAWSQRATERTESAPALFELAATLIGSGGTGITANQSAQSVAQGVREANQRLAECNWPQVERLYLVELYLDRASEAWRALQVQATAAPDEYQVTPSVQPGTGALRRPLTSGYRPTDYDFISAVTQRSARGEDSIVYTLDTKRARSEVRAQQTQGRLLRELITRAANDYNDDPQIGRTLFQLLVPPEMEPFLGGTTEMVLELDSGTAGIPWELLDSGTHVGADKQPWAIRAKLLRKLRTAQFRAQVTDSGADASVLVIGEPQCDPPYLRLPGARDEANAVARCLEAPGALGVGRVAKLISPDDPMKVGADARTIINALLARDWRIVHIAGHGEPPETVGPLPNAPSDLPQSDGDPRGVVLSHGTFLGPREIRTMRKVPELVFVNCCHLAARNPGQLLNDDCREFPDRPKFAAGVAEELIKLGVRCVVAAGWAVDDRAAMAFATAFYETLLGGQPFIDAVANARAAAKRLGGNTWAAYQCYGDPDWYLEREGRDPQRPSKPLGDEFAAVTSPPALTLALETLAVQSNFQKAPVEDQRVKIGHLERRFEAQWGGIGVVAEAFGVAWTAAEDPGRAIEWYERALAANDGTASIKASQELGNLRARVAWKGLERALKKNGKVSPTQLKKARADIRSALDLLEGLVALKPTIERYSLCGSAWKRLAMVEALANRPTNEFAAIERMRACYARAEALARDSRHAEMFYPALNRMAAELTVDARKPNWVGFDASTLAEIRANLSIKARDDPDFWSLVNLVELRMYEAIANRRLAKERPSIEHEFDDLHARVDAAWMWNSVLDQAAFVLPKYAERTSAVEKEAALALLEWLKARARAT